MSNIKLSRQYWIYKCHKERDGAGYSWTEPLTGFLLVKPCEHAEPFGGAEWIKASQSWKRLARVRPGDVVFCYQVDAQAIVGITVADSYGYTQSAGDPVGECTGLNLGPERVRLDSPLTVSEVQGLLGPIAAFEAGSNMGTFHEVEQSLGERLLEGCCKRNEPERSSIAALSASAMARTQKCLTAQSAL